MKDLRVFLEELKREHQDEIVEVDYPVSPEYEVTAYWRECVKLGNPVLYFKQVVGCKMPLVANVFGSRQRVARMIGADVESFYDKWREKLRIFIEPELVGHGPVKEVKKMENEVDLTGLPILKFFKEDAGKYITSGIVVANHPDTGEVNLSYARMQLKGRNKLGVSLHSRGFLWSYFQRAVEKKMPWLDVAVVIGCHPTIYLAAASRRNDEYVLAGALAGEPVQLTKCETKDIYIPAHAEIVLEGRILTDVNEDEGPFSEYTGYLTGRSTRNILVVDCITHRNDAIFQTVIPTNSSEHLLLGGMPTQATYYAKLKESIPQVHRVNFPVWGTHFVAIVSVDKSGKEGLQLRAALSLIGVYPYVKYVILVDKDVDVFDENEVFWALATRSQPHKSISILPLSDGNMLDPSQEQPGLTSRAIIDATRPIHWAEQKIYTPTIPDEVVNRVRQRLREKFK
ncbi:MAG: UbiD family decarboxylase [Candidatus Caldarchaeum sp.]|nr:UbiD family decarboxylase [Candidatus Caldarchaeum sp.]MDW8359126.1 UbiD family decarboxylase [Candidatus Caldarchaeum sp.]